jgi:dipeptidyl aminopeptidase/acylaminoacyl peptidase
MADIAKLVEELSKLTVLEAADLAKALEEAGAPVRTHFFEKGGHGIKIRGEKYPLSTWPELYLQWLRDITIIE